MLEGMPIEEQIKYFNNAKIIIAAHGAALSNMLFCKKSTYIIEVVCDKYWAFFDIISKKLKLNHHKIKKNELTPIVNQINKIII